MHKLIPITEKNTAYGDTCNSNKSIRLLPQTILFILSLMNQLLGGSGIVIPVPGTLTPTSTSTGIVNPTTTSIPGARIAAFADQMANATRKSCTSDGVGVVTNTNYSCMRTAINNAAPPYPTAAYTVISNWATNGDRFNGKTTDLMCVDFVLAVTAGAYDHALNNGDANLYPKTSYPGYTYISKSQGAPQAGDILVEYNHVAIIAQVVDSNHIRIAEANYETVSGGPYPGTDTGVVSNDRIDTVDDTVISGWLRKQ